MPPRYTLIMKKLVEGGNKMKLELIKKVLVALELLIRLILISLYDYCNIFFMLFKCLIFS